MRYSTNIYSDGQVTANTIGSGDLVIETRGNTYSDLFRVASIKEAWDANPLNKMNTATLTVLCLIGQRSDRRFAKGASFDLKVIAKFINSMDFDCVKILHPHSDVSLALIDGAEKLSHLDYVKKAYEDIGQPVLISPDAGAYKTAHHIAEAIPADLIPANKVRVNGVPEIQIQGNVTGKTCLIADDLADGGRTFKLLADELKKQGAISVNLYVTHAQFNNGFEELKTSIDHVYCTNSYRDIDEDFVTQYKVI